MSSKKSQSCAVAGRSPPPRPLLRPSTGGLDTPETGRARRPQALSSRAPGGLSPLLRPSWLSLPSPGRCPRHIGAYTSRRLRRAVSGSPRGWRIAVVGGVVSGLHQFVHDVLGSAHVRVPHAEVYDVLALALSGLHLHLGLYDGEHVGRQAFYPGEFFNGHADLLRANRAVFPRNYYPKAPDLSNGDLAGCRENLARAGEVNGAWGDR